MNPFADYKITSQYGERISPITKKSEFHSGIDLVKAHQADIRAFMDGECIFSQFAPMGTGVGGFGNTVLLKDTYRCVHLYGHLDSCAVKVGDMVKKGQVIGKQGNTGQSVGSHLHYEVRTESSPSFGWKTHTDPTQYLLQYLEQPIEEQKTKKEIKTITVKAGYTLGKIAEANNLTLDEIIKLNPQIKNINLINIGEKINIK